MAEAGSAFVKILPDLGTFQKTLAAEMAPITSKFSKAGKGAGLALAGGLLAGGAVGKALYDIGKSFDDATDKIRTGTGATGKQLEGLRNDLKRTYATVPSSLDDTATAITKLNARLHLSGKPLQDLARQELNLSRITKTDLGENIDATTRLFGDWAAQIKNPADAMDRLFRLTQKTGIPLSDLSRLMVAFGSPLRQLGFDFDHAAAMFGKFEAEGVNLQTIMPGFRFALKNLSAPTGEAADMMKKLGVNTKEPSVALREIFADIKKAPSDLRANAIAFAIFGRRAGPDMAAAIREGRFSIKDLLGEMRTGKGTIDDTAKKTNDLSENWAIFTHRIQTLILPIADQLFRTINSVDPNAINFSGPINSMKQFWREAGLVRAVFRGMGRVAMEAINGLVMQFQGAAQMIRGTVKIISGILTGDFGRAWRGVKDIFTGATRQLVGMLRLGLSPIAAIISNPFEKAVGLVRGFINAIISVINTGLGPIGVHINPIGGGGGGTPRGARGSGGRGRGRAGTTRIPANARGGFAGLVPGSGSGDKVLMQALVEPSEGVFIMNRNAMAALQAWNESVPRFAGGGLIGQAQKLAGAGPSPGDVIGNLPGVGSLPSWLHGMGSFVLDKVKDWIKKKLGGIFSSGDLLGAGGAKGAQLVQIGHQLQGAGFQVGEHPAFGGVSAVHTPGSYHYRGRAIDVNWPSAAAEPAHLVPLYNALAQLHPAELFYQNRGIPGPVPNHWDHLHLGFRKGGVIGLAKGGFMGPPLFTKEGPPFYAAAFKHNRPFALPGPYQTDLGPQGESKFRAWAKRVAQRSGIRIPLSGKTDYDYRGFWKSGLPWHPGAHFPDTFKTPFDTSFSNESKYATADNPFYWANDRLLVDARNKQIVFKALKRGGIIPPRHGRHWIKGGSNWSVDEAATLLWQAGLPESDAKRLARVVPGESGGNPRAHNPSGATGLFQILGQVYPGNLWDPRINALNAIKKYLDAGRSLSPWEAAPSGRMPRILRDAIGSVRGKLPKRKGKKGKKGRKGAGIGDDGGFIEDFGIEEAVGPTSYSSSDLREVGDLQRLGVGVGLPGFSGAPAQLPSDYSGAESPTVLHATIQIGNEKIGEIVTDAVDERDRSASNTYRAGVR